MRLGEMLVEAGGLSQPQLEEALKAQLIYGGKLGTILIELGFVNQEFLTSLLARQSGLPPAPIDSLEDVSPQILKLVPRELAERYTLIPFFKEKRRLHVAILDPSNLSMVDEVSFATGLDVRPYVAPELLIWSLLERYYEVSRPERYIRISEDPALTLTNSAGYAAAFSGNEIELAQQPSTPQIDFSAPAQAAPAPAPASMPVAAPAPAPAPMPVAAPAPVAAQASVAAQAPVAAPMPVAAAPAPAPVRNTEPPAPVPAPLPFAAATAPAASPAAAPTPAGEELGPITLPQVVRKLLGIQARDEILGLVFRFGQTYFENIAIFMLRADGYHMHVAKGSREFQMRCYTLTDGVSPDSFGNCFGRAGFHLGPVAPGSDAEALLKWLNLPNGDDTFMVPLVSNQRAGAIVLCSGPMGGTFSNEDLRAFQMFMEKCSLAVQMLTIKQRLLVLPAEMARE
ncbi:MAG: hypothetical protein P1V51_01395 [Deltaproteobacteria bacterium]|nr:hypothetical protein [Deltaproteobacteria bacterium]